MASSFSPGSGYGSISRASSQLEADMKNLNVAQPTPSPSGIKSLSATRRSPSAMNATPARSASSRRSTPQSETFDGLLLEEESIFFVTQESPVLIYADAGEATGVLTNVRSGEKGQAQFYHADVRNSGEEIVEFEKVHQTGESRLKNGDLIYIRAEGLEEDTYCYLKGQSLSSKCVWGRHRDSSTKSQFRIRIKNPQYEYLTEVDEFELVSQHWPDKVFCMQLSSAAAHRDQCGIALLVKPGSKGHVYSTFRSIETTLEDRTWATPKIPAVKALHMPMQLKKMEARPADPQAGRLKDCPYCGLVFHSNPELVEHLEGAHIGPRASSAIPPPAIPVGVAVSGLAPIAKPNATSIA